MVKTQSGDPITVWRKISQYISTGAAFFSEVDGPYKTFYQRPIDTAEVEGDPGLEEADDGGVAEFDLSEGEAEAGR